MNSRARLVFACALSCLVAAAHARSAPTPALEADALPNLSGEEVAEAFARMDSDRDGQVSLEEFETGIRRPYGAQREGVVYQRLPARFRVLDGNADGFLAPAEYEKLAARWPLPGTPPPLAQADRNRDGRIDFREFAAIHAPRDAAAPEEETTSAR